MRLRTWAASRILGEDLPSEIAGADGRVQMAYARAAKNRQAVLRGMSGDDLGRFEELLVAEHDAGSTATRELYELEREVAVRAMKEAGLMSADAMFFDVPAVSVPPPHLPRARRATLEATGHGRLVKERDREDRVRARLARRAAASLLELEEIERAPLGRVLIGAAGRRWLSEGCGHDLDLARDAIAIAHPGHAAVVPVPPSADGPSAN